MDIPQPRVRRARQAISINFLLYGIAVSSWAPMVPLVKERLGLDEGTLGLVLLGMGAGGLVTLPVSGFLAQRLGTQTLARYAAPLVCVFLPLLALAPTPLTLALCLFGFSAALGGMSISMNSQAIEIDTMGPRPVLSRIHGLYSLGALSGSALMSAGLRAGFPLWACTQGLAFCLFVTSLSQRHHLLPNEQAATRATQGMAWPSPRLAHLGFLCAILFLGEGAMLDWSAVFLHSDRNLDIATAGLGYTGYAVAMTASRFLGDMMIHRFGSSRVLRQGCIISVMGLLVAILTPWSWAAITGFAMVGFGLANTVPVVFAASGRMSGLPPSAALPMVTMLGSGGLLVGPAVIGLVARMSSLSIALGGVALLLAYVALRATTLRTQHTS